MDFALPHHGQSNSITPTRLLSPASWVRKALNVTRELGDWRVRKSVKNVARNVPRIMAPTGSSAAWQRATFGTWRPGVQIPPSRPQTSTTGVKVRHLCLTSASVALSQSATRLRFLGDTGSGACVTIPASQITSNGRRVKQDSPQHLCLGVQSAVAVAYCGRPAGR